MTRTTDILLTGMAPAIWGSTYVVTTEFLPPDMPVTLAMLRALPAGLLLLALTRTLPTGNWRWRVLVLGALNFAAFWSLLFVAAYRLPGGVAATVAAIQPLFVIGLAAIALGSRIRPLSLVAAGAGLGGVALLVLGPAAEPDMIGVGAALGGALSMAAGTVLTRKWQPPVSLLTFTAWQLTAGGLLLLPLSMIAEPDMPALSGTNIAGLIWLGGIGAALTYFLWFRGIRRIEPAAISTLGFLSPVTAVLLGWIALGQDLSVLQMTGLAIVLGSIWLGQAAERQPGRQPDRQRPQTVAPIGIRPSPANK